MFKGIKFISQSNQNGGNEMLINNLAESVRKAKQEIYDNAKYYSPEWKRDNLKELKKIAHEAYLKAIEEFEKINNEYENKISEIEKSSYQGYSTTPEYIENVKYAKTRLLADIKINPNNKDKIIN
ncbi:MAG TPA: hypothetical protein GX708_11005, partial [Gallicola sp.]|nr:hypothetical protein [Gallicola sp.]